MTLSQRFKPLRVRLLLLLSVVGPGIITANVDNDAGGITTYSVAGAHYGYSLLWMMPLVALALIIVQEMSARLGVVTGKGLADLIRERLGVRLTALIIGIFLFANLANTVSEFAGVAASMEIFGVSKYLSVPIAAVVVWLLIVKANYKWVERVFLAASAIFLAYIISGVMARPPWEEVARAFVTPSFRFDPGYVTIFVTIIGTTIAPWMQFYQQSSVVDKGLKITDFAYERIDVVVGSLFAVVVASFIMIACSHAPCQWRADRIRQRRGAGSRPTGRAVCVDLVRHRIAQRVGLFGGDPAALDRLCRVRGVRLGGGGGPRLA